jgi:hypothetical protein
MGAVALCITRLVAIEYSRCSMQAIFDGQHTASHRAAGPPTNASYRSDWNGLLPLVANLCEKLDVFFVQ